MNRLAHKLEKINRRKYRVRANITGTANRPRLSVYISNHHVSAQLIDDTKHITLGHVTTAGKNSPAGTMTQKAEWVGAEIAKKAKEAKIKQVVFDRGSRLYHGRIKALADTARKQGLEF